METANLIEMVVFDVDGTLTNHNSVWQYIHEQLGLWDGKAELYQEAYLRGEITYRRFCQLDAALWRGIPENRIRGLSNKIPYNPGVRDTIRKLKHAGIYLAALSTGLNTLVDRVVAELDLDIGLANVLVTSGGRLTGEVEVLVEDGTKGEALVQLADRAGIKPERVAAVGDSPTDIGMFRRAGLSIAYSPTSETVGKAADYLVPGGDFPAVADIILGRASRHLRENQPIRRD